ncbi:MAG: hypothetical protein JXA73_17000 [Acidobacteria bacterium]|nr:hypothetical protein [Acidobacteriota bacterium]
MKSQKTSALIMRSKAAARTTFFLSALLIIGLSTVMGADFWETKDFTKWSAKECEKLLTNSPWAWELKLYRTGYLGAGEGAEGQAYVKYTIRFMSALPIRMAQVRQAQIANNYDKLSDEQKQAFDKQTEGFLNADFSDKVVVSVLYETNVPQNHQELDRHWKTQTTAIFSNSVYLTPNKGEKARLLEYRPPQGANRDFAFIFPREVDGNPLITDENKSLILEFPYQAVGGIGDGKGFAEFKVKKMMIKGGLVY